MFFIGYIFVHVLTGFHAKKLSQEKKLNNCSDFDENDPVDFDVEQCSIFAQEQGWYPLDQIAGVRRRELGFRSGRVHSRSSGRVGGALSSSVVVRQHGSASTRGIQGEST
jgi:hypothetical protein